MTTEVEKQDEDAVDIVTFSPPAVNSAAGSESSVVPIELWDTEVQPVNPATEIVLASYPGLTGAKFWGRKCTESEAGPYNILIILIFAQTTLLTHVFHIMSPKPESQPLQRSDPMKQLWSSFVCSGSMPDSLWWKQQR